MRLQGTSNRGRWTAVLLMVVIVAAVAFLYFFTSIL
jgi:hypothetical protein